MKPKFYRKVLKNGMTLLFEKRDLPVVAVGFAVRQGGINESEEEKGISHFIEHLLYKGTNTRTAKQISKEIEKNGGILNGFTCEVTTAYWCKMPSRNLKIALDVLSDIVKDPLFDEKEVEKERKVIFEELKMRKDRPDWYVFDKIQEALYEKPLGLDLIGTYETMNSIKKKDLVKKFKEVYTPENMILCVVGDADLKELEDFVEEKFEKKKSKVKNFEVKKRIQKKVEARKGIDQANLVFAYHVPLAGAKGSAAAKLLNALMGEGLSSRLFEEIREKRNLAYVVKGASDINKDYAYNVIYAGTTKDNVEKVKELILKEFEKVAKDLGEKELEEVKEQVIGNHEISMEDSVDQMTHLIYHEINQDLDDFYDFEKKIKAVKVEEVRKLAKIKDYSFFALVPER